MRMAKMLLIIFCGMILWRESAFSEVIEPELPNDFPTKRKSSLFLVNHAIPGLDDVVAPEEIVPRARDYLGSSGSLVASLLKATNLRGNYPWNKLTIHKPKMPKRPPGYLGGEGMNKQLLNKLLLMDPVEQLLLKTKAAVSTNENDTENATTEAGPPENEELATEPTSQLEGLGNFIKQMLDCKMKLIFCKAKNIVLCYLHCLLGKHPVGQVVMSSVVPLIKSLCDPLGTSFETGMKSFTNHAKNIKTISHYLTMMNIVPATFKRFTRLAANAIPSMILKYSSVDEASLFKGILSELESDAKVTSSRSEVSSDLSNPGCTTLNIFKPVQKIVSMIYKKPKMINMFLPGLWTLSKLSHLISTPVIKTALKAFGGALDILVGQNCGLIHYTQMGSNSTCEDNEQLMWKATEDELMFPENGNPVICGAVPHIPPIMMDKMYPPIFIQDIKTTTVPPPTQEPTQAGTEANATATSWLDQVSKFLDVDDD